MRACLGRKLTLSTTHQDEATFQSSNLFMKGKSLLRYIYTFEQQLNIHTTYQMCKIHTRGYTRIINLHFLDQVHPHKSGFCVPLRYNDSRFSQVNEKKFKITNMKMDCKNDSISRTLKTIRLVCCFLKVMSCQEEHL